MTGCAITLPQPITTPTVEKAFGEKPTDDNVIQNLQSQVHQDAQNCAGRLNGHRNAARNFSGIRNLVAALGGVTSGAGGLVSAMASSDNQQKDAAIVAAIGGGIALGGTFVVGLIGDPSDRLKRHSDALRSWDRARTLSLAAAGTQGDVRKTKLKEIDEALQDCSNDKAPPDTKSLPGAEVSPR